jgi:hypothetical protein
LDDHGSSGTRFPPKEKEFSQDFLQEKTRERLLGFIDLIMIWREKTDFAPKGSQNRRIGTLFGNASSSQLRCFGRFGLSSTI